MATTQELATLAASTGRDRDILFLTLMIRHHRGSLAMARTLANTPPAPRSAPWPPRSSSPNRLTSPPSKQTYAASAPQPPDPSQPAATRDPPPGARATVRNGHRPCPHVGTTQGQRRDGFLMRRSVGRRPAVRARRGDHEPEAACLALFAPPEHRRLPLELARSEALALREPRIRTC